MGTRCGRTYWMWCKEASLRSFRTSLPSSRHAPFSVCCTLFVCLVHFCVCAVHVLYTSLCVLGTCVLDAKRVIHTRVWCTRMYWMRQRAVHTGVCCTRVVHVLYTHVLDVVQRGLPALFSYLSALLQARPLPSARHTSPRPSSCVCCTRFVCVVHLCVYVGHLRTGRDSVLCTLVCAVVSCWTRLCVLHGWTP